MNGEQSNPTTDPQRYDVLVVGGGPAGLNAALVLGRARRRVLLADEGHQRNDTADEMHGFITREGTRPGELLEIARREIAAYSTVELESAAVTSARCGASEVRAQVSDRSITARRIVLATGMVDDLPHIDGLDTFWGHAAFTCPYCDGWEMRDRRIAIAGQRKNLVGLAQELHQWSKQLTICGLDDEICSHEERRWLAERAIAHHKAPIQSLKGTGRLLQSLVLEDGQVVESDALFICAALVQRSDLPAALGCRLTEHGRIDVNHKQQTSVKGVYAAGDASEPVHQVLNSAASGARAAIYVNEDLTAEDIGIPAGVGV